VSEPTTASTTSRPTRRAATAPSRRAQPAPGQHHGARRRHRPPQGGHRPGRLVPGSGTWTINGRTLEDYFPNKVHQQLVNDPFKVPSSRAGSTSSPGSTAAAPPARPVRCGSASPAALNEIDRRPTARRSRRPASSPVTRGQGAQEGRSEEGAQGAAVQQALIRPARHGPGRRVPGRPVLCPCGARPRRCSVSGASHGGAVGRLFGTDGVRGLANRDLTAELALDLAVAAAHVLGEPGAFAGHRPRAVVGRDPRASGEFLSAAVIAGWPARASTSRTRACCPRRRSPSWERPTRTSA
jgi:hypothetical protein